MANIQPIYVNERDASQLTGISVFTFQQWRSRKNGGPPFYKFGNKKVVYKLDDLLAWCESRRHVPSVQPVPANAS